MNKTLRPAIIAGNWKMNNTPENGDALIRELLGLTTGNEDCTVVLCPPFLCIPSAAALLKGSAINLGAQTCHFEEKGAFTGEIAPQMLKNVGCAYVILGHSERRGYFGETDGDINLRLKAALRAGLTPILCVGESLEEREDGKTETVLAGQLAGALAGLSAEEIGRVVLAYEPIWAIGTGKTATPQQAGETCTFIRETLAELCGAEEAGGISILYGGSMNAKNAADLLACEDIDGGLIGGASLKAQDFTAIINAAG